MSISPSYSILSEKLFCSVSFLRFFLSLYTFLFSLSSFNSPPPSTNFLASIWSPCPEIGRNFPFSSLTKVLAYLFPSPVFMIINGEFFDFSWIQYMHVMDLAVFVYSVFFSLRHNCGEIRRRRWGIVRERRSSPI